MKLIKLKCDGCGAILKANKELKKITCNYCGTEFYIDEAKIKENERKIKELGYQEINNKRTLTTTLSIFGIIIISCLLIFFYYKICNMTSCRLKLLNMYLFNFFTLLLYYKCVINST